MRIARVHIENFRSIESAVCEFDSVTTLVGPNGAGKSTILRALDWFFNGEKGSLSAEDLHQGAAAGASIRVRVDFDCLTPADRDALGSRYGSDPSRNSLTVWRTWSDGDEKITAKALAYPQFEVIRAITSASEKRIAYNELRTSKPALELPACASASAVESAMNDWERDNSHALVDAEISDTHFFGFNSRGKLSELFDYVFVSADLRATDETSPTKSSILSRILQRAVDRSELDAATEQLFDRYVTDLAELSATHLGDQLRALETDLTTEISAYSLGRSVHLREEPPGVRSTSNGIGLHISDAFVETSVERQGHGFQRTLLLSALTVLSARARNRASGQMFLAIEEPELFQHPTQARAFASVLRQLAGDAEKFTQVAYATHSPYFVEPRYFDQIRRVSTTTPDGRRIAATRVTAASLSAVGARLQGFVAADALNRRLEQVCLKFLPAALFAESAILVEGEEDAAVLEGMGAGVNELAVAGICVAPVNGKNNMLIPFAILELLGVHAIMVVDNDSGAGARMAANQRSAADIDRAEEKVRRDNRAFCRFVGSAEEDYPVGAISTSLAFVPDTMETLLRSDLPGWDLTRRRLIEEGRGVEGKNAATYEIAARECDETPSGQLASLLNLVLRSAA